MKSIFESFQRNFLFESDSRFNLIKRRFPDETEEEIARHIDRFKHRFNIFDNKDMKYIPWMVPIVYDELRFESDYENEKGIENITKAISYFKSNESFFNNNVKENATTYDELMDLMKPIFDENERNRIASLSNEVDATRKSDYKIIPVETFEEAKHYGDESGEYGEGKLCYTQSTDTWNDYTKNGANKVYVCLKNGWENIPCKPQQTAPYDEYGLSMIFVFVDIDGKIIYTNTRWNHQNAVGTEVDHSFREDKGSKDNAPSLGKILNVNVKNVFRPYTEEELISRGIIPFNMVQKLLDSGKSPESIFEYIHYIKNGLYRVGLNDKNNLLKDNKILCKTWFDYIYDFNEGRAAVKQNGKWGFIDTEGNLVINYEYDDAIDFNEGLAKVKQNGKWGFIDTEGNLVINYEYDYADDFHEGLARVYKNGKWGFIDTEGNLVINYEYDDAYDFNEGLARVKKNGKWGFIDKKGNLVIDCKYDNIYDFHEGLARVRNDGKWGLIDTEGNLVINYEYDAAYNFHEGLVAVKQNDKWNLLKDNKILCKTWFEYIYDFHEGLARVRRGYKWGFIDTEGNLVINYEYVAASDFHEGLAAVKQNGKWGFIDTEGNLVIDCKYDDGYDFNEGLARVQKGNEWFTIDTNGNRVN